jgi:hypothetical protein
VHESKFAAVVVLVAALVVVDDFGAGHFPWCAFLTDFEQCVVAGVFADAGKEPNATTTRPTTNAAASAPRFTASILAVSR